MASEFLRGFDCRCKIGVADSDNPLMVDFSIKKFGLKLKRPRLVTTNTVGRPGNRSRVAVSAQAPGKVSAVGGSTSVEVMIEEATLDWTAGQNLFMAPFQIATNSYLRVQIFPNEADLGVYHDLWILVDEVSHEGEVEQLQPVSFKGETDGNYLLIGE